MLLRCVRLWAFPYTAQPAGEIAGGLRVRGTRDLCANECAIGAERSGDRMGFLSLLNVSALAQEAYLDRLDDYGGSLLNCVHQARNDRRTVLLAGITCNVWKRVSAGVEADRGADDEGDALGDRLARGAIVGLPYRCRQRVG